MPKEEEENKKKNSQFLSKKRKNPKKIKKKLKLKKKDKNRNKGKNVKNDKKDEKEIKEKSEDKIGNPESKNEELFNNQEENEVKNYDNELIKNEEKKEEEEQKEDGNNVKEKGLEESNKEEKKQLEESEEKRNDNEYKNKLRKKTTNESKSDDNNCANNINKGNQTKVKLNKFFSEGKSPKLEKRDELPLNNSSNISQIQSFNDDNKIENMQLDILSCLNINNFPLNDPPENKMNDNYDNYSCHLIKFPKNNNFVYSYKIKRYQGVINNIIFFECNNKKCRGRGEYYIDKKMFKETATHNLSTNSHKISSLYYNFRDMLLMDKETNGYQLLKDNNIIKDKKIMLLLN